MIDFLRDSVRPVVTYSLVAAVVIGFFLGRIPADPVTSAALVVLGYWFGEKSALKMPTQLPTPKCPDAAVAPLASPPGAAESTPVVTVSARKWW